MNIDTERVSTMTTPTPQGETPETLHQFLEQWAAAADADGEDDAARLFQECSRRLREALAERDKLIELKLPMGSECSTCRFRYWTYKGHIIPCPRCAAEAAERNLEIANARNQEEIEADRMMTRALAITDDANVPGDAEMGRVSLRVRVVLWTILLVPIFSLVWFLWWAMS